MEDQSRKMKMEYKAQQQRKHILSVDQVEKLFHYIEFHLEETGCNHTRKHTEAWLKQNIADNAQIDAILLEMEDMGGYCDCEVVANCYEDYDL